ncbi:cell division topological specificity factor MinE [Ottowia sp.]|uniref:cell division topological specificity factor MinE n=1 Tax=Ottowia sp. TaxID=1898956 RepID=UPI003A83BC97
MSFISFFLGEKKKTANVAKERLQIILAHERARGSGSAEPDYLPDLQRDLIAVISKYVKIDPKDIKVNLERQDDLEVLEVKIELPEKAEPKTERKSNRQR